MPLRAYAPGSALAAGFRARRAATPDPRLEQELAQRLDRLEAKTDAKFAAVFEAIRQLTSPPDPKTRPVGIVTPKEA